MLKKLQSLKAKKGFTLVELIVVIAIIAVLAAILVPTMMGYVTQSRVTSADTTAQQLKDTVGNSMVEMDTKGNVVPETATITLGGTSDNPSVSISTALAADDTDPNTKYKALKEAIEKKIKEDYTFTKAFTAVVYVSDRKAVGAVYSADAQAKTTVEAIKWSNLKSGKYQWGKTTGIKNDYIIGTYPKAENS